MRQVEAYLDLVLAAARLAPADARRVRGELQDHLLTLIEAEMARGISRQEAWTMVQNEFGEPARVGGEIARAKGRVLTYLKKKGRSLAISLAIAFLLTFSVKSFAVSCYWVAGSGVEPYAFKHTRVLVNRLASTFQPDDLVVYQDETGRTLLGIVQSVGSRGDLVLRRNSQPEISVRREQLIGRVFLQTR